jgi:hypothetical protein
MWRLLLFALCFVIQAQNTSVVRLYPVDDTARDPAFRSFVKKLQAAVTAHNAKALRKLVDDDVVVGPAKEDAGWAKFEAKWHPDDADSDLWPVLADLVSLGFVREHPSLFLSPYLVWRFPRELNLRAPLVVIRDKASLRATPSQRGEVVSKLSFDIVQQQGPLQTGEDSVQWVPVRTLDGQKGYLNARDVMSPFMPRAQFGTREGRWLLIALETQG